MKSSVSQYLARPGEIRDADLAASLVHADRRQIPGERRDLAARNNFESFEDTVTANSGIWSPGAASTLLGMTP
jgi:hypothetical protein